MFALFNAGVAIDADAVHGLASPVSLGIIVGLGIGKAVGVILASWLAVKVGLANLPEQVSWRLLIGTGFLAGIGFTMALFISGLAFSGTDAENEAKLAILVASVLAAIAGIGMLWSTRLPAATRARS